MQDDAPSAAAVAADDRLEKVTAAILAKGGALQHTSAVLAVPPLHAVIRYHLPCSRCIETF